MLGFSYKLKTNSISSEDILKYFKITLQDTNRLVKLDITTTKLDMHCIMCNSPAEVYSQVGFNPLRVVFFCTPACLQEAQNSSVMPDFKVHKLMTLSKKAVLSYSLIVALLGVWFII